MNNFLKRVFDFTTSSIGCILISPILVIIALLIKLTSKGPILFKQKRVGRYGKEFNILKFRTMVVDAEKLGKQITVGNDSRITKVGSFLRKYKLDELPQLINVIKGDMSLVGPRPSLPNEVKEFEPWMLRRLEVKPGLTCYWQVMGRNNIDFENWMKLDIKYVNERSFWLDIKLIFKTFFVLFGDENAA